ncbi:MAG: hypothetical protein ACTHQQ_14260 [Solirubrobacteraceae bacterium]
MATSKRRKAAPAGLDRLSSVLFVIAAFLAVLALLAWQFKLSARAPTRSVILLRRVYQTRVIETVRGPSRGAPARGAPAVTQSVSSSGSAPPPSAPPTTASSGTSVP